MGSWFYVLVLIGILVIAMLATIFVVKCLRPLRDEDFENDTTNEAEELRRRADVNVVEAKKMAARAKRLEYLVDVQRRGHK